MKVLAVDREKIKSNLECVRKAAGGAELIAVLKANAYGLGLREIAGLLREEGVRRFAVTEPSDALRLRDWGFADEEILVLRSSACEDDIRDIIKACATASIGSYDAAVALNGMAEKESVMCDVHLEIDTGMGRYGFEPNELERMLSVYRFMSNLNVTGVYTHYANAFCSKKKTKQQYDIFMNTVQKIRDAGFDPGLLHASNSSALFFVKAPSLDAVRVGSAIGGRLTAKGDYELQKAGRLESQVAEVRWLPKGHAIGYGSCCVTKRAIKTAVVPVGTADGFMMEKGRDSFRFRDCLRYMASAARAFVRGKCVYISIGGKRARVLGHVGVNHTVADVTDIECSPGTPVVLDVQPMFVPESVERAYR